MQGKPGIPKGTRDFLPEEMAGRNYIFDTVKSVFRLYGFQPIETPAMENLSTLMGKYGDEGDKLLFKILNSGNFMSKVEPGTSCDDSGKLSGMICDRGLRYDLTVPFARFVVQHQSDLIFPFKRYQIQPVWRADRPQKGRYREFYQCDVDIIGSDSLLNEVELVQIIDDVFKRLSVKVVLKLNNRKILAGIAELINESENLTAITVAIDKLDKIGYDGVVSELKQIGLKIDAINKLTPLLSIKGGNAEKLKVLSETFQGIDIGLRGVSEMEEILNSLDELKILTEIDFDVALARGLNYYTGSIFEVKAVDVEIGSVCGGGRYDDLTGVFGITGLSGVGVSFGADRIYDVMVQTNNFPKSLSSASTLMFVNFGKEESAQSVKLLAKLRQSGISSEIYPDSVKMKKQMNYANRRNISFVAILGENEMRSGTVTVKNMATGDQVTMLQDELAGYLKMENRQ